MRSQNGQPDTYLSSPLLPPISLKVGTLYKYRTVHLGTQGWRHDPSKPSDQSEDRSSTLVIEVFAEYLQYQTRYAIHDKGLGDCLPGLACLHYHVLVGNFTQMNRFDDDAVRASLHSRYKQNLSVVST